MFTFYKRTYIDDLGTKQDWRFDRGEFQECETLEEAQLNMTRICENEIYNREEATDVEVIKETDMEREIVYSGMDGLERKNRKLMIKIVEE